MSNLANSLLDAYETMAAKAASAVQTTLTIEAEIVELMDAGIGLYTVKYKGNQFSAFSNNLGIKYNVGDTVYILVPDGDLSNKKIILSTVKTSASTYSSYNQTTNKVNILSENLISDNYSFELYAYKNEESEKKYISSKKLGLFLEEYNSIQFNCIIKTNLSMNQQGKGNYGVKLSIPITTLDSSGNAVSSYKTVTLDVNNILGNPYRLTAWTKQSCQISFAANEKVDTTRDIILYGFTSEFLTQSSSSPDIFIKDFSLYVIEPYTEEQLSGYNLTLKAENGLYFLTLNGALESSKKISAELMIDGKSTSISGSDCFWFIEDASVNKKSEYYLSYGGVGWKCLNSKTVLSSDSSGNKTYQYVKNNYSYSINSADVHTATKVKCIVVYDSTVVTGYITLRNLTNPSDVEVTSATGSNYVIKDTGVARVKCTVKYDNYDNSLGFDYYWMRFDKDGNYLGNDFYKVISLTKKIGDNLYEAEIEFPASLITESNLISCSVYAKIVKDAIVQNILIGSGSVNLTTLDNSQYILSIVNGDKIYKYDADGDSPLVANYDGPITSIISAIEPITYKIYKADGSEFTDNDYGYCRTTWKVPIDSMIDVGDGYSEINGYYIITDQGRKLDYQIAGQYNYNKSNNTVLVEIVFNDTVLNGAAALGFLKDGESGTNGSKYAAILEGTSDKYFYLGSQWKKLDNNKLVNLGNEKVSVKVYCDGEQITSQDKYTVNYTVFNDRIAKSCISVNNQNGILNFAAWQDGCPIIQAEVTIVENTDIPQVVYAYYPIDIIKVTDADFHPYITGGFNNVLYASDGSNPRYNSSSDFIVKDGYDIGYLNTDNLSVNWSGCDNLTVEGKNFAGTASPLAIFNNHNCNNAIKVSISSTGKDLNENGILVENGDSSLLVECMSNIGYNNIIGDFEKAKDFIDFRYEIINLLNILIDKYNELYDYNAAVAQNYLSIFNAEMGKLYDITNNNYYSNLNTINANLDEIIDENYNISIKLRTNILIRSYNTALNNYNGALASFKQSESNIAAAKEALITVINNLESIKDAAFKTAELQKLVKWIGIVSQYPLYSALAYSSYLDLKNWIEKIVEQISFWITVKTVDDQPMFTLTEYAENVFNEISAEIAQSEVAAAELNIIKKFRGIVTIIHPIVFVTNRYEMSYLNGWDGNKLYTGDNEEYLFAPQVGAGHMDNNRFTGMVIGEKSTGETGLFGYNKGEQTVNISAEDGSATFGTSGVGQIQIKPGDKAIIQSGGYESNNGLQINLTESRITGINGQSSINIKPGYLYIGNKDNNLTYDNDLKIKGGKVSGSSISGGSLSIGNGYRMLTANESEIELGYFKVDDNGWLMAYDESVGMGIGNTAQLWAGYTGGNDYLFIVDNNGVSIKNLVIDGHSWSEILESVETTGKCP